MIPKIVHQMGPVNKDLWHTLWIKCNQSVRDNLSTYQYMFWSHEDTDRFVKDNFPEYYIEWSSCPLEIIKIDIARLMILYVHGGVYLDLDVFCYKDFYNMLDHDVCIVGNKSDRTDALENFLMAGTERNSFFINAVKESLKRLGEFSEDQLTEADSISYVPINSTYVDYICGAKFISNMAGSKRLNPKLFNPNYNSFNTDIYTKHMQTNVWGEEYISALKRQKEKTFGKKTDRDYFDMCYNQSRNIDINTFDFYKNYTKDNTMEKYRFVIVGGGTAGMMTATLFKNYWGNLVDVTVIYDHKNPGIGVGESLTPSIYTFLNYLGITREDMIANVNATVKLGLQFKNWLNDGGYYYHNFSQIPQDPNGNLYEAAYDIIHNMYDNDSTYSKYFMESSRIPIDTNKSQSLHIDATLFSKFLENRFKDHLTVVDGVVNDVIKSGDIIESVLLKDGRMIKGDFFVDASGFQYVLFKHLTKDWVDKKDWLPLDKCIPNPLPWRFTEQPTFTTSEASDQGWILQVPLSNRWGTGYLYSSEFLDDDRAFHNFETFLNTNYGHNTLANKSKVLTFKSGYWRKQWVGNCIAVGLASGFTEPLEATNIHHVVVQTKHFIEVFNFNIFNHDVAQYNKHMQDFYDNVYLYLRFCYTTNRTDSEFWKYMTNTVPQEVKDLEEKVTYDILSQRSSPGLIFHYGNYVRVANGLKKINKESWKRDLKNRNIFDIARLMAIKLQQSKLVDFETSVDHLQYVQGILTKK